MGGGEREREGEGMVLRERWAPPFAPAARSTPTAHTNGAVHARSPTGHASGAARMLACRWFWTARGPGYGDPWVKGSFRLIILATMITDLCFSFIIIQNYNLKNSQTSRNLNAVFVWTINNTRRLVFKNVEWWDFLKLKSDIGIYEFCSWNNSNGFNLGCSFYSLERANSY